jgi:hypothetical protein
VQRGLVHETGWANGSCEWYTPSHVFEALGVEFDLDPAAPPGGVPWVPAARYFTRDDDGLAKPWAGRIWLNPPYGRETGRWLARLAGHGDGIALIFARSDTAWFQRYAARATAVCFVAGRLKFVPGDGRRSASTAGAPSLMLGFGLPCALALSESGLGQTFLVPQCPGGDREALQRSDRQSPAGSLDSFNNLNHTET